MFLRESFKLLEEEQREQQEKHPEKEPQENQQEEQQEGQQEQQRERRGQEIGKQQIQPTKETAAVSQMARVGSVKPARVKIVPQ